MEATPRFCHASLVPLRQDHMGGRISVEPTLNTIGTFDRAHATHADIHDRVAGALVRVLISVASRSVQTWPGVTKPIPCRRWIVP